MTIEERKKAFEKVAGLILAIKEVIDRPVSLDDAAGCQQKLLDLIAISGTASHAESVAKAVYDSDLAENIDIVAASTPDLGATNIKIVAQGRSAKFLGQANYAERLGRNISHGIDGMRSIVSALKYEMEQAQYASQNQ